MIYFVTDRKIAHGDFYRILEEAVAGGVDGIILREKDLGDEALFSIAAKIKAITTGTGTELIVNNSLAVAKKVEAEGYHIGFSPFIEENETKRAGFFGKIGVSVHSIEEAVEAEKAGADYLLAGHIFPTGCKPGVKPRGTVWLQKVISSVTIPVIAIGGIEPENLSKLSGTGLTGVAVRSLIMQSPSPKQTVRLLQTEWQKLHQ